MAGRKVAGGTRAGGGKKAGGVKNAGANRKTARGKRAATRKAQPTGPIEARFARLVDSNAVWIALALAGLHLLLALATFMPTPHTGGDSAAYIALGRSLLERGAYLSVWDPALPAHTQYPPVFPGIIAIATLVGLGSWVRLKIVVTAFTALAVGFSFLWVRARGRPLLALAVALLLAISPGALIESHWVLSDVPFFMFTMLALLAWERLDSGARWMLIPAVLATVLAYFTRSAGLPLALAALVYLAVAKRYRQLAVLAGVLLPLGALWWLRANAHGGVDYVGQFWFVDPYTPASGRIGVGELFARIAENTTKYVSIHLPILQTGVAAGVSIAVAGVTALLALAGWLRGVLERVREAGQRMGVAEIFLPLYVGLLLVWPAVWSGERFLLPALPLLLYYAGDALAWVTGRIGPRIPAWAGAGAVLGIAALAAPRVTADAQMSSDCTAQYAAGVSYPCLHPVWEDFFRLAEISRRALPDGSVVISRKPRLFYQLTGWPGRIYPLTEDRTVLLTEAEESGARYVVLDRLGRLAEDYLGPVLMERTDRFCVMYARAATGTALLGIRPAQDTVMVEEGQFPFCDSSYWRDEVERERVIQEMAAGR